MLPKIEYPLNSHTFDSLGTKVSYRPMLVKEEKVLLMAKQGRNPSDIFSAIKQIVNNCVLDEGFDIDSLPIFELEYLFLRLRIASMGNEVTLTYRDQEDEQEYHIKVRLEDIRIKFPEEADPRIKLPGGVGIEMRYPPASLYDNERFVGADDLTELSDELLIASIAKVWDEEDVYRLEDSPREEVKEFIESIDSESYRRMQAYLSDAPHMEHVINYRNTKGTERRIVLRTLNDFFTL